MPYLPSKVRMMSSGSDAPPDTATRSADRSRPVMSCLARACSMVRTPPTTVQRSFPSASRMAAGTKRGTIDRQPPYRTNTLISDERPNTWKKGSTASTTSSARAPNSPPAIVQFMYSWKWVSSAPFGLPVVPLVVDEHGGVVGDPGLHVAARRGPRRGAEQRGAEQRGAEQRGAEQLLGRACAVGQRVLAADQVQRHAGALAGAAGRRGPTTEADKDGRRGVGQVVFELGCHQQRVERQHDKPGLERPEVGGQELRHVRQLQPDDLPWEQAGLAQAGGETAGLPVELAVRHHGSAGQADRSLRRGHSRLRQDGRQVEAHPSPFWPRCSWGNIRQ